MQHPGPHGVHPRRAGGITGAMSQLTLIRHGQAAAFTADSDRLTDLGVTQAKRLGDYLVAQGRSFEQVVTGGLLRQRQTAEHVAAAYAAAGRDFPVASVDAGWDEYDAGAILPSLTTALRARDPEFARIAQAAESALGTPEQNRYFQRAFEVVMDAWVGGETADGACESFDVFQARILAARDRVRAAGAKRVAVFTSGGPIGINVAASLGAPSEAAMRVNYRVRNASLTDFLFSGTQRLSFDGFNAVPHLEAEPGLVSYR